MTFILAKTLVALSLLTLVQSLCPLCGVATKLPKRWGFMLEDGQTCRDVYVNLGGEDAGSAVCVSQQQKNQELCCGDAEPVPFDFPPTMAPAYNGPVGDEPDCPICGTGEYPGIPSGFITARYVGSFSCSQLFHRGLNGMTPSFMCGPLQDFAEPVCGCGGFNPKCKEDPTECWGYAPGPTSGPPPPAPAPSPVVVQPTSFERKEAPQTGKFVSKLSDGRGGAAARLRGGRQMSENISLPEVAELPELDSTVDSSIMEVEEVILQ